jgi:uncharacterized protein YgbK (DUF1537 family)
MAKNDDLVLSFYGDDFTGTTDAMEAVTRSGLRTVMFIEPPRPEQLAKYQGLRAVGLAGGSRTMSPQQMDAELAPAFKQLQALKTPFVHYKMCSTFDSSPQVGSIGHAIDLGMEAFGSKFVPLLVGAPVLGRYCAFGNLFARSGLDTEPCRLDRHPTMRRHPITPMDEADLRVHLAKQTRRKIGLLDVLTVDSPPEQARAKLEALLKDGCEIVLFDVIYDPQLELIGRLIYEQKQAGQALFIVGSSGVEYALTAYMKSRNLLPKPWRLSADPVDRLVIVSGSCSPVTDRQLGHLINQGAVDLPLETERLVEPKSAQKLIAEASQQALKELSAGRSVVLHSCRGPQDPRIEKTRKAFEAAGQDPRLASGRVLGTALGELMLRILAKSGPIRAAVTGGDTSHFVAKAMGIEALEMLAPLAPGAPLCTAYAPGSQADKMEIVFKGGQNGKTDFFDTTLRPLTAN